MADKSGFGAKEVLRVSATTSLRYREPTNAEVSNRMTQFIVDYAGQRPVIPADRANCLVEGTHMVPQDKMRATNINGKSAALGPLAKAVIGTVDGGKGTF